MMAEWLPNWTSIKTTSQSRVSLRSATAIEAKTKRQTRPPQMYRVLILNDDFTPMDFVVHVLQKFFAKEYAEAMRVMLQVHHQGAGLAGVFSHEVAETKVYQVNKYAHSKSHPLKCIMEKT